MITNLPHLVIIRKVNQVVRAGKHGACLQRERRRAGSNPLWDGRTFQTVKRVVGSVPSLNLFCVCFESEFVFCSKILLGNALCDSHRTLGF
jgi:hypothetical protein